MKNTAIPLMSVSILLLAGCTNSFAQVRDAVNQAPEWYGERRAEIRGEGYPKLYEVPELAADQMPGKTLPVSAGRVQVLQAMFDGNERAAPPADAAAEMAALLQRVDADFAGFPADPGFLTQEEIMAIEAAFNVPRVTEGLKVHR
ncbi:MAG: hypothetical protein R3C13_11980 [Hyphomonas sp.]|uniref:hypothetical protein n=1 Tax=Hyphomonas sp. TaxID=87 RepID=UPI003529B1AF